MSIITKENKKRNILKIKSQKNQTPITMITAYDALFAKIFDGIVDIILVGDSLKMSFGGQSDTLGATMSNMIYHTNAVCNGAKNSLIVMDMPFSSCNSKEKALKNATKVYKQTKADAIKIEGGAEKSKIIKHLTKNAIAVMGHIGLMPQFARLEGGYRVKGKSEDDTKRLINDAKALENAGVFAIVLEGVKSQAAEQISKSVNVPIIGIGAGSKVDGQVLVWSDAFGFFDEFVPKFAKRFLNGKELIKNAVLEYVKEVQNKEFPAKENEY